MVSSVYTSFVHYGLSNVGGDCLIAYEISLFFSQFSLAKYFQGSKILVYRWVRSCSVANSKRAGHWIEFTGLQTNSYKTILQSRIVGIILVLSQAWELKRLGWLVKQISIQCSELTFDFQTCRGNFDGQLPYQSGASCSACPADRSTCLQNLCCKFGS